MKFLTWDSGIIIALGLLLSYSLLIRKHKSLATLVSVYVGYVMAAAWGSELAAFFTGDRVAFHQLWVRANVTPWVVQSLLMALVAFLLSSFVKLGGRRSRYSTAEVVVYAVATLALALSFVVTFMPIDVLDAVQKHSQVMPYIVRWKDWIQVLPVFIILFFGIYSNDDQ